MSESRSDGRALPELLQLGVWKIALGPEDEPEAVGSSFEREPLPIDSPLLSAALIVRDEERLLPDCLKSLKGLADEVVVVDTGSRDRSIEIAQQAGARIFHVPWREDFGAPRRHALSQCRGRWILQIDADETVRRSSTGPLRELLCDRGSGGYYVNFQRRRGLTRNWQLKLYRREGASRYRGVVHENLQPSELRRSTGLALKQCPLEIDHRGYEGDPRPKARRNLPLLRRRLRDEESSERNPAFLWLDVADSLRCLGDESGYRDALDRALCSMREAGLRHPTQFAVLARAIELGLEDERSVESLLEEARSLVPEDPYLAWLRGRSEWARGDADRAAVTFEGLAHRPEPGPGWIGYDQRLFGPAPERAAAVCRGLSP